MVLSAATLADVALSDAPRASPDPICPSGALADFALGSVALSGSCDAELPEVSDICHTGALGAFGLGVVTLAGNTCPFPVNPARVMGGAGRPRASRGRAAMLPDAIETDDEEVILLVAQALVMYAHTR